jgi:hypothetical protein
MTELQLAAVLFLAFSSDRWKADSRRIYLTHLLRPAIVKSKTFMDNPRFRWHPRRRSDLSARAKGAWASVCSVFRQKPTWMICIDADVAEAGPCLGRNRGN